MATDQPNLTGTLLSMAALFVLLVFMPFLGITYLVARRAAKLHPGTAESEGEWNADEAESVERIPSVEAEARQIVDVIQPEDGFLRTGITQWLRQNPNYKILSLTPGTYSQGLTCTADYYVIIAERVEDE